MFRPTAVLSLAWLCSCAMEVQGNERGPQELLVEVVIAGDHIDSADVVGVYSRGELDDDAARPRGQGEAGDLHVQAIAGDSGDLLVEGFLPDPRPIAEDAGGGELEPGLLEAAELLVIVPAPGDGAGRLAIDLPGLNGEVLRAQIDFTIDLDEPRDDLLAAQGAGLLKRGMCGPAVRTLQNRLVELKYRIGAAEQRGCYGDGTWYAVQAFQRDNGLASDGDVGPNTSGKLAAPRRVTQRFGGHAGVHIEVFQARGVLHLFRGSALVGAYASSTGAGGATPSSPAGGFTISCPSCSGGTAAKENPSWSGSFKVWLPWMSYLAGPGLTDHSIGIHEYPDVPDVPASHGCVRVPYTVSQQIYQNAAVGTKVYIVP